MGAELRAWTHRCRPRLQLDNHKMRLPPHLPQHRLLELQQAALDLHYPVPWVCGMAIFNGLQSELSSLPRESGDLAAAGFCSGVPAGRLAMP
mmetsp:Transcript_27061/g.59392  ORF Transcript_27061/g.59392 Transcript_27061/m.59392 type:complete len:92 (-) Transcript_27061:901-1176(-)